jgi:hypothetical protein
MKEKIIEILDRNNAKYWNEDATTKSPKVGEKELEAIHECDNQIAEEIIKLFKNK